MKQVLSINYEPESCENWLKSQFEKKVDHIKIYIENEENILSTTI